MANWAAGYVTDIDYTGGVYRELSPVFLAFAALAQGVEPPSTGPGATYCELGCGKGVGTAIMAAANPGMRFWGIDFNPAHIAQAQRLAARGGLTNVAFRDDSFAQALDLPAGTLPQFDFITVHGVYSWVTKENRQRLVAFMDKHLKPGGLVYLSYNALPGWSALSPMRWLMRGHADRHPDRSDRQADQAAAFVKRLIEAGAGHFVQTPAAKTVLDGLGKMDRAYVAHEYLNAESRPFFHADVARDLAAARLSYVGSAALIENIDDLSVPQAMRPMLVEAQDPTWRETLRDFACNKSFRRDIFQRGVIPLSRAEAQIRLDATRLALTVPRKNVSLTLQTPLGEANGQPPLYLPLLDALADRPHSLRELADLPELKNKNYGSVLQAACVLVHSGQAHPLVEGVGREEMHTAQAFNRAVLKGLKQGRTLGALAAPMIGTSVSASFTDLIGLSACQGKALPIAAKAADQGWALFETTGQRLMKDGAPLTHKSDALPELEQLLQEFLTYRLPILRALAVL